MLFLLYSLYPLKTKCHNFATKKNVAIDFADLLMIKDPSLLLMFFAFIFVINNIMQLLLLHSLSDLYA